MAKLSAGGRICMARCFAENCTNSWDGVPVRYVTETRLMSDRNILEKVTIHRGDGTKHNWGWKRRVPLSSSTLPASWVAWMQKRAGFVSSTLH